MGQNSESRSKCNVFSVHNTALDHPEDVRLDLGPPEGRVLGLEQLDEFVAEHLLQAGRGRVVHHSEVLANENEKSPSQGRKKKNHEFVTIGSSVSDPGQLYGDLLDPDQHGGCGSRKKKNRNKTDGI